MHLNLGLAFNAAVVKNLLPWKPTALKVVQDEGTLVRLTNVLSPLDKQSGIKLTNTRIANVYNTLARGSIPVGNQSTNTSGQSIFCELSAVASKLVGTVPILVPVQCRIEFRLPNDGDLTNTEIESLLLATYSSMCNGTGIIQVTDMMRGALFPAKS